MNASSTGSSCKEVAGGAAGAQTGLSGMLDSPKDMKASMAPAAPPGKPRCWVSEGAALAGSGVSPAAGGEIF